MTGKPGPRRVGVKTGRFSGARGCSALAPRGDATVGRAEIVAALEGKAHLVGEHGPLFLVQAEAAGELKFVGRLVVGVSQVGEEEFTEIHVIYSSHDARAVLWDWR